MARKQPRKARTTPVRAATAPSTSRPAMLAPPITPTSAAAATSSTPTLSAYPGRCTNGTNKATAMMPMATYSRR